MGGVSRNQVGRAEREDRRGSKAYGGEEGRGIGGRRGKEQGEKNGKGS